MRDRLYRDLKSGNIEGQAGKTRNAELSQFQVTRYFGSAPEEYLGAKDKSKLEKLEDAQAQQDKRERVWKSNTNLKDHEEFHIERRKKILRMGGGGGEGGNSTYHIPAAYRSADELFGLIQPDIHRLAAPRYPHEKKRDFAEWDKNTKRGKKSHENFQRFLYNTTSHLADIAKLEQDNSYF